MAEVSVVIAFVAGLASFFAPCILPLVPAFLGFLAGTKVSEASRWELFRHSVFFVIGFSAVFAVLGVLLNGILSHLAYTAQVWLAKVSGIVIAFFGLYILGVIKPRFLMEEHKIKAKRFKSSELTSVMFGAAFAVGWTPCIGAILGSILALAAAMPGKSFMLLLAYAVGLGIPFLIAGLLADKFMVWVRRHKTTFKYFNIVVGVLMVVLGVLVFTGNLASVANGLGMAQLFAWLS